MVFMFRMEKYPDFWKKYPLFTVRQSRRLSDASRNRISLLWIEKRNKFIQGQNNRFQQMHARNGRHETMSLFDTCANVIWGPRLWWLKLGLRCLQFEKCWMKIIWMHFLIIDLITMIQRDNTLSFRFWKLINSIRNFLLLFSWFDTGWFPIIRHTAIQQQTL